MSAERFGALPLGELHAEHVCYRCGLEGKEPLLKRTVNRATLAIAHVCVDPIACERRYYNRRRRI